MQRYKDRREVALKDVEERLTRHVMREEPVRSFRFHGVSLNRQIEKDVEGSYPFAKVKAVREKLSYSYTSFYAFTLTWTPGHMTLVGDLGEMTVVHYQAMPTLEEACNWLQSPDFNYLLSKTNHQKKFDRDLTIADVWHMISEYAHEAETAYATAMKDWEAAKPKWRKRYGMTKDEYDTDLRYWQGEHPDNDYGFREATQPSFHNKNLWSQAEKDGWHAPDGLERMTTLWRYLNEHSYGTENDPKYLLTQEGRDDLLYDFEQWARHHSEEDLAYLCYHILDLDYSGTYEYDHNDFFRMAAIRYGAERILQQLQREQSHGIRR